MSAGLTFDGFNRFGNISDSVPNIGQILVYREPELESCLASDIPLKYNKKKEKYIYIKVLIVHKDHSDAQMCSLDF